MAKRSGTTVDFSGVESGGREVPDDQYLLEVLSCEEKESGDGNPYLAWKWKVVEGPYKGATIYDNTSLQPQALWRLKMVLECFGNDVPNGKMELKIATYKGKQLMADVANETYQGKKKPRITGFLRGSTGSSAGSSAPGMKKGSKVTFEFDDATLEGVITGLENGKVIVTTEVDGTKEEWELKADEVTLA